jgi:predicted nucleic acid-binding protein
MMLLDANIVSEATKPDPARAVPGWLDGQAAETLYQLSVTVAELMFGIGAMPAGRRRGRFTAALDGVLATFANRILPFDTTAARR